MKINLGSHLILLNQYLKNVFFVLLDIYNKKTMSTKLILDNYLGKNTRVTEKDNGNGFKEVCDLDTGDCYTIRMKDGLIERVDNTLNTHKKIQVETKSGIKQLLNGLNNHEEFGTILSLKDGILKLIKYETTNN